MPGRYFGIILYDAIVYNPTKTKASKVGAKIALGVTIGIASTLLSGGMFTYIPISDRSNSYNYFDTYFILIDKEKKCFVHFNHSFISINPLKTTKLKYHFKRIFYGILYDPFEFDEEEEE